MKKIKTKITIEPFFTIGQRVMFKENLLIVEIKDILVEKNKYKYKVFYPHLYSANYADSENVYFMCFEDEIEAKPIDYNQIIFNAYIEYKCKYEDLLKRLSSPSVRRRY